MLLVCGRDVEAATQLLLCSSMDFLLQCILQHGIQTTAALLLYVVEVQGKDVLDMQWSPDVHDAIVLF